MLRALPFTTFGEAAALGLEAHVYCPSCYTTRQLDPMADNLRGRSFAGARFRCTNVRWTGNTCGGQGTLTIQPAALLPVGGDVRIAFLWCDRCLPPWQISHIPIDRPPWNVVGSRGREGGFGERFRCPGCGGRVAWNIRDSTWRPTYSHDERKRGTDG